MLENISFLNIACYKWGTLYPANEVNILWDMVRRNLNIPHVFHCVTDDPAGLNKEIRVHELEEFGFPGNCRKIQTYSSDFLGLEGEFLVNLDIDLVIIDSLDFLAQQPEKDFIIARNWGPTGPGHTAVFRLKVGSRSNVWDSFISDPGKSAEECKVRPGSFSDQRWLSKKMSAMDFFPEGKVVSYKHDCNSRSARLFGKTGERLGLTTAHFGKAKPPRGAAIVSFHGRPLPRDVCGKSYQRWKRADFVKEHWREM